MHNSLLRGYDMFGIGVLGGRFSNSKARPQINLCTVQTKPQGELVLSLDRCTLDRVRVGCLDLYLISLV